MSTLNSILLQAGAGGGLSSMLMIVAMIAIFYFVMIRPQSKKQKELKVAPGMELEFDKASIYPAGEPAQEKEELKK